jgi:hypothetical protein
MIFTGGQGSRGKASIQRGLTIFVVIAIREVDTIPAWNDALVVEAHIGGIATYDCLLTTEDRGWRTGGNALTFVALLIGFTAYGGISATLSGSGALFEALVIDAFLVIGTAREATLFFWGADGSSTIST